MLFSCPSVLVRRIRRQGLLGGEVRRKCWDRGDRCGASRSYVFFVGDVQVRVGGTREYRCVQCILVVIDLLCDDGVFVDGLPRALTQWEKL